MDYSTIDQATKEDIAERIAMAVTKLDGLAYLPQPDYALKSLLEARRELVRLVNDLGGHPAVQ